MKNFIYATGVGTSEGQVSLVNVNDGVASPTFLQVAASADNIRENSGLAVVLHRSAANGGDVLIPLGKQRVRYTKMAYAAGTAWVAKIDLSALTIEEGLDYTVILVKQGVQFNERSNWTATVRATSSDDADSIISKLAAALSSNAGHEATVTVPSSGADDGKLVITGKTDVPYNIVLTDALTGVTPTITDFVPTNVSAAFLEDLANKCAADAGFEYTYEDGIRGLYPKYPFVAPQECDILTIFSEEPREVKTRDEVVRHLVHIAVPDGTSVSNITDPLDVLIKGKDPEEEE